MFETLFSTDCALARHRNGLATERARYLRRCADLGGTLNSLRNKSAVDSMGGKAYVAKRLRDNMTHQGCVRSYWVPVLPTTSGAPTRVATLLNIARPWLKYLGLVA